MNDCVLDSNKMKFLLGKKEDFVNFLDSIKDVDRVAVLGHNDLDGMTSAIFLEKILLNKGIKPVFIDFVVIGKEKIKAKFEFFKSKKINKIFIVDLNVDSYSDLFREAGTNFDFLLIDHHPVNPLFENVKGIIKSEKDDCTGYFMAVLAKDYFDVENYNWLICATLISEYSFKSEKHVGFIKTIYPDFDVNKVWNSEAGKFSNMLDFAIIYYKKNLRKVYKLICDKDLVQLQNAADEVRKEVEKYKKKFEKEAEYYPKQDLYFWYIGAKFSISSIVNNLVSCNHPDSTLIFVSDIDDKLGYVKVSARNQNSKRDMRETLKRGMKDLEEANCGGHIAASGGSFRKVDLEKFKQNLING